MISDEIRQWCDETTPWPTRADARAIADRIDNEMVELPRDRDGVPIHVGDKMYLDDRRMFVVVCIKFVDNDNPFFYLTDVNGATYIPAELTHTCPDSLKIIAADIESAVKWCDRNGDYGTGISSVSESTLRKWADRIRKLAEEEARDGD